MTELAIAEVLDYTFDNFKVSKATSLRPFKGSTDQKHFTAEVDFSGCKVSDAINKAVAQAVKDWQNSEHGRKNYANLVDRSVVKIKFTAPTESYLDPELALDAKLSSMSAEEQQAELARLVEKFSNLAEKLTEDEAEPSTKD